MIARRVEEISEEISNDYRGREVLIICVLKGAFIFLADLARCLKIPHAVDFVRLASYGSGTTSSGKIAITKDIETSIEGKDVIVVEDIVDTGLTLAYLKERLLERNPHSLKLCALIDKKHRRKLALEADYVGFTMGDGFIVGYGLDYDERFRFLPDIYTIEI
jgi:hypoxanthine phosphoribosyltransferase